MKRNHIALVLTFFFVSAVGACGQGRSGSSAVPPGQCAPVETGGANAPEQKPAFPGQTRACAVTSGDIFDVTVVAKGLDKPWAVEPLPDGDFLITEKSGQLRIVSAKGEIGQPITGLLPVGQGGVTAASGQGGLPPISA